MRGDEGMASYRKKRGTWFYRYVDGAGRQVERKGHPDLVTTKLMAAKAESEAVKVRSGLIDARDQALATDAARPLADHLDAWESDLLAKGATPKHAGMTSDRARRLVAVMRGGRLSDLDGKTLTRADRLTVRQRVAEMVKAARLSDLTPDRVQAALASIRAEGRSLQTCNHHRAAIRAFTRWAWKSGRLTSDLLIGVAGFNAKEDRRHDWRTLSLDDLRRLIDAAQRGPTYRRMTGPARALCYRLAVASGLRHSEIGSITPEAFDFGTAPSVTVAACYTKNGEPATLPLPGDVAADLAAFVAELPSGAPVFTLPNTVRHGICAKRFGTAFARCLHAYPVTAGMAGRQSWPDHDDAICCPAISRGWSTLIRGRPCWRGSGTSVPSAIGQATASCFTISTSVSSCSTSFVRRLPACAACSRLRRSKRCNAVSAFGPRRWGRLARPRGCSTPRHCTKSCANWPVRLRPLSLGQAHNSCSISPP